MSKRQKVSRSYSKKVFKRTTGQTTPKNNTPTSHMRGGRRA